MNSPRFTVVEGGMGYVARAWANYDRMVLPKNAGETQRRETKLAFYAGAACLFAIMLKMLDQDEEATEADMAKIEAIHQELADWGEEFDRQLFPGDHP